MRKFIVIAALIVSAATISAGTARAQQPAAAPANSQPAAQDKTTTPPAAKPAKPAATKSVTASGAKTTAPLTLTTTKAKLSYALGMNFGENLHKQSVEVDPSIVVRGMKDGLAGGKTLMTEEEARTAITDLMAGLRKQHEEQMQKAGEDNKKDGETFLAANKSKPGVLALPSGLQYKILQAGTGPKPAATDSVVCNYRGTLINGKEFDSSYKRGQPATFPVGGVIKGWTEALQLMPAGSKWQLFIPSELAYGPRGAGADIGPNATLVFEVELISIQEKAK